MKRLTQEEKDFISANYEHKTVPEMEKELKRSEFVIRKYIKIKLDKSKLKRGIGGPCVLSDSDKLFIKENYTEKTCLEMSIALKQDVSTIYMHVARKLNISLLKRGTPGKRKGHVSEKMISNNQSQSNEIDRASFTFYSNKNHLAYLTEQP